MESSVTESMTEEEQRLIDWHSGFAGIYKGLSDTVNEIPAEELTVSILRYSKPIKLLNGLQENGFRIETPESGIYRIIGVVSLPLQIIVIRELEDDKLLALKIMSDHAKEDDVRRFLTASRSFYIPGDRHDADAVLQVSSSANRELYQKIRKEEIMCQALKEIMSEEIAEEHAKGLAEGRVEGRAEGQEQERLSSIKNLMDSLKLSAEDAMNALKISASDQARYAAML